MLTLSRRIYFMLENVSACLTVWVNEAHNQKYTELVFIVPSTFSHSICNGENCKDLESRRNVKIYFHLSPHSVLTLHAVFSRSLNVFSSSYLSLSRVATLFFHILVIIRSTGYWVKIIPTGMLAWIAKYLKCVWQLFFFTVWSKFTSGRGYRKWPCIYFASRI